MKKIINTILSNLNNLTNFIITFNLNNLTDFIIIFKSKNERKNKLNELIIEYSVLKILENKICIIE
jgi:hypothetical protein